MSEIESRKMDKNGKVFTAIIVDTIAALVEVTNEYNIPREDVISILRDPQEGYVMFCYK